MFLSIIVTVSIYAETVTIDKIHYEINEENKTAAIKDGRQCSGDVIVPSSISYNNKEYIVTSIKWDAFAGCSALLSISLPSTISFIDRYAFGSCSNLRSITIPENVTRIERSVFGYCTALESVILPKSLQYIDSYAFEYCSSLSSIVIPDNVDSIKDHAFNSCSSLTNIHLPENLAEISDYLFNSCDALSHVDIPQSVKKLGYASFYYCKNLRYVNIPNNVTEIEYGALFECTALDTIDCYLDAPISITSATVYNVPQTCKLIVNDGTKSLWENALYWKNLTIIERNGFPDGLEDTSTTQSRSACEKLFRDGQIFILRGDKTYTLQGQEVK